MLLLLACARHLESGTDPYPDHALAIPFAAVAADHPLASEAGARVLREGGNAVDAAIAAALASGVVQPSGSGLGGGGFALVVTAKGDAHFLDFREVAPAAASRDMYATGASSTVGALAVAVPAEGVGLAELHRRWGKADLPTIAAPAIGLAQNGFVAGAHLAASLLQTPMEGLFGDGNRRPRLATAIEAWRDTGGEAFRSGWVAEDFVAATGGAVTLTDLAGYAVKERAPIRGSWRGHTIWSAPPPSFGGIALIEMLGATEAGVSLHCQVESAKHAMAQRAASGGDPDFTPVPVADLTSGAFITRIRNDCAARTHAPDHYAPPSAPPTDHGTLHISVIDKDGMAVALTTTINTSFGSRVVAPRSNIVLNNEMDDFAAKPGVPNAFGLVQGESNSIAPGKRPLSSMTPTIVTDGAGAPILSIGASGGPFIITATFQVIDRVLRGGVPLDDAIAMPRWHHQWLPDVVMLEPGETRTSELEAAGHVVKELPKPFCAVQAVYRSPVIQAVSDPRKSGAPAYQ